MPVIDEEYVCSLSEASLEKAKKELNEDPKNRLGAVQTLREWIEQQKHLHCITSTRYLLPYLRTAKFSQLRAREIIEGNLTLRTDLPHWYHNLDPADLEQIEALKLGIMVPLPGYDKEGRKILMLRQGAIPKEMIDRFNKDKKWKNHFFKGFLMALLYILYDEDVQVNGLVYVNDFTGYTMAHMTSWSMAEIKDMMRWQGNSPGRFKCFYYYNTGSVFEMMMEIIKPFMKKKFKERIQLLGGNLENLYKHVPMEILPDEYLPDDYTGPRAGSVQQITDNLINELQKPHNRDRFLYETRPEWRIDMAQKDKEVPTASFRKLNVD